MTTELWITGGIALGGLILGVINFIRDIIRYSPRLKFRTSFILTNDPFTGTRYCIQVTNISLVNLTIESIGIGLSKKQQLATDFRTYADAMPVLLKQGQSTSCLFDSQVVAEGLHREYRKDRISIRPFCTDSTGKQHESRWRKFSTTAVFQDTNERIQRVNALIQKEGESTS